MRKINCGSCGKNLGVIRDAKLAKGIEYTCRECSIASKVGTSFDFAGELNKYRVKQKKGGSYE